MPDTESLFDYVNRKRLERGPLPTVRSVLAVGREAGLQADTAMRSAANALTFGHSNQIAAAGGAAFGSVDGFGSRYQANLARETARDRYDAIHRSQAQKVGELGALAASLGRGGPLLAGALRAPRLSGAAAITGREAASALAGGGALGVGGQAVGDVLTGQHSSPRDYVGAAIGGVTGVAALPFGASSASAVDGAVTSVAQDVLNGQIPSLGRATQNALAARVAGNIADRAATAHAAALPPIRKGPLGETMGAIRSLADGRPRDPGKPTLQPATNNPKGPRWRPDGVHTDPWGTNGPLWLEDKFGPAATVSRNQKLARAMLQSDFQLNHFLPVDVGLAASVPASALAIQAQERLNQSRPRQ